MLRNPGLADGGAGWEVRPGHGQIVLGDGMATLVSRAPERAVVISQAVDIGAQRAFRLQARVEVDGVEQGSSPESWHAARVTLVGQRPNGRLDFNRPTDLFRATGSSTVSDRSGVIELADSAVGASFMVRLDRVSGTMRISNLSLSPVAAKPAYTVLSRLLGVAWVVVLVAAASGFVSGATSRPAAAAVVGIVAGGMAFNLLPSELAIPTVRLAHDAVGGLLSFDATDRLLHGTGFALLAIAWCRARAGDRLTITGVVLVALAVGSEVMQGIPGGLGVDDIADALVNLAGVAIGLAPVIVARAPNAARGPKPPRA
jgi:hypothetical protein